MKRIEGDWSGRLAVGRGAVVLCLLICASSAQGASRFPNEGTGSTGEPARPAQRPDRGPDGEPSRGTSGEAGEDPDGVGGEAWIRESFAESTAPALSQTAKRREPAPEVDGDGNPVREPRGSRGPDGEPARGGSRGPWDVEGEGVPASAGDVLFVEGLSAIDHRVTLSEQWTFLHLRDRIDALLSADRRVVQQWGPYLATGAVTAGAIGIASWRAGRSGGAAAVSARGFAPALRAATRVPVLRAAVVAVGAMGIATAPASAGQSPCSSLTPNVVDRYLSLPDAAAREWILDQPLVAVCLNHLSDVIAARIEIR